MSKRDIERLLDSASSVPSPEYPGHYEYGIKIESGDWTVVATPRGNGLYNIITAWSI